MSVSPVSATRVSTIGDGLPFARTLAELLLARYGAQEALSRVLLLLPSRRACLAMREAFLEATRGKAALLPRIEPLGDADADLWMAGLLYGGGAADEPLPPAMSRPRQVMELARLVHAYQQAGQERGTISGMEHAVLLAEALVSLMEECIREQVPPERIRLLVEESELARHWEISLEFLEIILTHWPQRERELGMVSPAARQQLLLGRLTNFWRAHPPAHPVIAAGSTGSIPATAELMAVVASLPMGEVVLPGLDIGMPDDVWEAIGPTHPQAVLKEWLQRVSLRRQEVQQVPDASRTEAQAQRVALLREVMLPPEATHRWREADAQMLRQGSVGICRVACDSIEQEAVAIALKMRETLETPGKTAIAVAADKGLLRRVQGILGYYGIQVDDSSGIGMHELAGAVFLRLLVECVVSECSPAAFLALLRHPLCLVGHAPAEVRQAARDIERALLRGQRPAGGASGLRKAVAGHEALSPQARRIAEDVFAGIAPLEAYIRLRHGVEAPFVRLLDVHLEVAQHLAGDALWAEHEGNKLHAFFSDLALHAPALGVVDPASYSGILVHFLSGAMYQPPYGGHPRLALLSPLEARLHGADVVILGGLNEESWPPPLAIDPWMNAAMRTRMGLPPLERATGQSAHDVVTLGMAPEVMMTRANKNQGAQTIPSRWWLRMDAVLEGQPDPVAARVWRHWARALFAPQRVRPLQPPAPSPPVSARPQSLYATQLEKLMADPYGFYAASILRLRPLAELDAELDASDFGMIVHAMLEAYACRFGEHAPVDARAALEALGRNALERYFHHTQVEAFWWPRIQRIAAWCAVQDAQRRSEGMARILPEATLSRAYEVAGRRYDVRARIDRIEQYADGRVVLVDYKTGEPPAQDRIAQGVACQLPLEAWIAAVHYGDAQLDEPEYWKVSGGREPGRVSVLFSRNNAHLRAGYIERTQQGLHALLTYFTQEDACYLACPDANIAPAAERNPYVHLERLAEWAQ